MAAGITGAEPDAVSLALGHRPGKVIAVHVNFRSRAAQRGGPEPKAASYFLKPSSSLTGSGAVARPGGTELLAFEGEIAVVIGRAARHVRPEDGWAHVGWVTAANDLGLHDLRAADRGSNLRSKGGDGYTPLGLDLLPADGLDPAGLRLRTWLDGDLVQDDTSDTLMFDAGMLIADLSRVMTLEPGDVILTGTPAGASVAEPGQTVEVEVSDATGRQTTGRLRTQVIDGPPLAPWGAPPRVDAQIRADARGGRLAAAAAPRTLDAGLRARLHTVAVATLAAQLRRRGHDGASIDGVRALAQGTRLVGPARTLRFVPHRPDLFADHGSGYNAQKRAFDTVGPGEVLVIEARGDATAGTLGDILALRAKTLGAAGIVTDGAVRDAAAVGATGLPVYAAGRHPAVLGRRHVPWEVDGTVSCGGTTVQPGDVVVGDDDGAVVIPRALVLAVLDDAEQQEREEAWIADRVADGSGLEGLYPLTGAWRSRFDADAADIDAAP